MFSFILVLCLAALCVNAVVQKPSCSRFDYDEKVLEKLIRVEHRFKQFEERVILEGSIFEKSLEHFRTQLNKGKGSMKASPAVQFRARDEVNKNITNGGLIIFETTDLNTGDGYDVTTGIFTAPHSGLYMFSLRACSSAKKWTIAAIKAANVEIGRVSYINKYYSETCSTGSGFSSLSKGEKVYVEGRWSETDAFYSTKYAFTEFSGVLVHD